MRRTLWIWGVKVHAPDPLIGFASTCAGPSSEYMRRTCIKRVFVIWHNLDYRWLWWLLR
jgi:hypothetical protein